MRRLTAILLGKLARFLIHSGSMGAGVTWPGELAIRIDPEFIFESLPPGVTRIAIVGTNGKTTTAKMLETILTRAGRQVKRNESGANLANGIAGCILSDLTVFGKLRSDTYIFELDEAAFAKTAVSIRPDIVIFLNLFRDQLDRYGEVDTLVARWAETLKKFPRTTMLVANADDPHVSYLCRQSGLKTVYFGLEEKKYAGRKPEHAADSIFCPACGTRLTFGSVYFSHLGKWACGRCRLTHPDVSVTSAMVTAALPGVYNLYNSMAATAAAGVLGVAYEKSREYLTVFSPAFGRGEEIIFQGANIKILLAKNPTGANEALKTALAEKPGGPFLFVLNDQIPDGRDVSWIWDVDFEMLKGGKRVVLVAGERVFDLAVRIQFAGYNLKSDCVFTSLPEAIDRLVRETPAKGTAWILPTYSAMLEVRKYLTGRGIL